MADRNGREIRPGDPVLVLGWETDDSTRATVLRHLGGSRYLVQLDPRVPGSPEDLDPDAPDRARRSDVSDTHVRGRALHQQPFVVDGARLEVEAAGPGRRTAR